MLIKYTLYYSSSSNMDSIISQNVEKRALFCSNYESSKNYSIINSTLEEYEECNAIINSILCSKGVRLNRKTTSVNNDNLFTQIKLAKEGKLKQTAAGYMSIPTGILLEDGTVMILTDADRYHIATWVQQKVKSHNVHINVYMKKSHYRACNDIYYNPE